MPVEGSERVGGVWRGLRRVVIAWTLGVLLVREKEGEWEARWRRRGM
jgi:hypothetical protein